MNNADAITGLQELRKTILNWNDSKLGRFQCICFANDVSNATLGQKRAVDELIEEERIWGRRYRHRVLWPLGAVEPRIKWIDKKLKELEHETN